MSSDGGTDRQGEMTLVFTLPAVQTFADPETVFDEAGEWSRFIGIVDNDTDAVAKFVHDHGLRQDFDLDDGDKWLVMEHVRATTPTPRHVFVGTSVEDRRIADHLGWEYRRPSEVAEKAGWSVGPDRSASDGVLDRLRGLFSDST